tara:strand:+ start:2438 stop:3028 length:591 start_codon:yes stop_codon:yes gene_type:complete
MESTFKTGSLETLTPGQTLLVHARKVNGGKLQLELAEKLQQADRPVNALSVFNKSDDRFSQGAGARRAWMIVEPSDTSELLGVDLEDDSKYETDSMGRDVAPLNILNPAVNDQKLRVQIVETTDATEWDANNIETRAKRRGKNGDFITHKGMYIFTQSTVVFGEPNNVFLEADAVQSNSGILANHNVSVETGEIFS